MPVDTEAITNEGYTISQGSEWGCYSRRKKYRSTKEGMEMPLPKQAEQAWDDLNSVAADADDYDNFSCGDIFQ